MDRPRQPRGHRHPAPLHGASHGPGGPGTVSRHPGDHRPHHPGRFLLRLQARQAVHARGAGEDRGTDARAGRAGPVHRARGSAPGRGHRAVSPNGRGLQGGDHLGHPRRDRIALPAGRLGRPVPRAPLAQDRLHPGLQAHIGGRRLLARRRAQRDAPAHLRHLVPHPKAVEGAPGAAGGGAQARPPQARQGAGPLQLPPMRRRRARSSTPRAPSSTTPWWSTCAASTGATATRR